MRQERLVTRERDAGLSELGASRLLVSASTIVQMAEERPKPDAERKPSFQKRQWSRLSASMETLDKRYHEGLDKALFRLGIERAMRDQEANAEWLTMLFGKSQIGSSELDALLTTMYAKTDLDKVDVRSKLIEGASLKKLRKSRDPFIQMALRLRPLEQEIEANGKRLAGRDALLKPRYLAALRAHTDGPLAPDANSTLRVTFGTVRGYRKSPEAEPYEPFTSVSQIMKKNRGEFPFAVPQAQQDAIAAKRFGAYVSEELGEVPVNFLTTLDTTGGNSGSPTLNRKGELIGLIFDGNYESMASDYVYIPELTRSIHCDYRYMLWIMDAVDQADHLLVEMGITPSVD